MNSGNYAKTAGGIVKALGFGLLALAGSTAAMAAAADSAAAPAAAASAAPAAAASAAPAAAMTWHRMAPTLGKGMPIPDAIGLQKQYSVLGDYGYWMHQVVLLPIIIFISLFVLGLLVWVVIRYNKRANPVPSRTTHNTTLEVVWTLVPVLILVGIAVPSIDLLAKQFKPAPANALTIKATGNQWFWTYDYPDNGDFEVVSYMLNIPGYPTINPGKRVVGTDPSDGPKQLEVDNRLVLPVGEPIRIQVTGADVIHSFAVPSLWFKLDGEPGRINEKVLTIKEPGVYYGQCSELCGERHAYMPIVIEAVPRAKFDEWVMTHPGAKIDHQGAPAAAGAEAPAAAAPAPAASAVPAADTSGAASDAPAKTA